MSGHVFCSQSGGLLLCLGVLMLMGQQGVEGVGDFDQELTSSSPCDCGEQCPTGSQCVDLNSGYVLIPEEHRCSGKCGCMIAPKECWGMYCCQGQTKGCVETEAMGYVPLSGACLKVLIQDMSGSGVVPGHPCTFVEGPGGTLWSANVKKEDEEAAKKLYEEKGGDLCKQEDLGDFFSEAGLKKGEEDTDASGAVSVKSLRGGGLALFGLLLPGRLLA